MIPVAESDTEDELVLHVKKAATGLASFFSFFTGKLE
jgi:hypothetical protein